MNWVLRFLVGVGFVLAIVGACYIGGERFRASSNSKDNVLFVAAQPTNLIIYSLDDSRNYNGASVAVLDRVADTFPELLLILPELSDADDDRDAALLDCGGGPACEDRHWVSQVKYVTLQGNQYQILVRFSSGNREGCEDACGKEMWTIQNNKLVLISREIHPWVTHSFPFTCPPEAMDYFWQTMLDPEQPQVNF
jgi:hypothetical protein